MLFSRLREVNEAAASDKRRTHGNPPSLVAYSHAFIALKSARADGSGCSGRSGKSKSAQVWRDLICIKNLNQAALMSALGQKQTSAHVHGMSALPPKADIRQGNCDVRFVPRADIPA
jgi:hypothetical protein